MNSTGQPSQPNPVHARCWACGATADGLNLRFDATIDGVEACFDCDHRYAGYPGIVQGGVVAAVLDSAMTNCLFRRGVVAVTAELTVRYRHPVRCGQGAVVRAWVEAERNGLYLLRAELRQADRLKARAAGKFLPPPHPPAPERAVMKRT